MAIVPFFTTIPNQQDYWISGCTANVFSGDAMPPFTANLPMPFHKAAVHLNSVLDDPPGLQQSGTTVLAVFNKFAPHGIQGLGTSQMPPRFFVGDKVLIEGAGDSSYNGEHIITFVPTINSFTFELEVTGLQPDGGQGINQFSWMEHATLEDFFSTAFVKPKRDIEVVFSTPQESIVQPPYKVCMQFEEIQQCGNHAVSKLLIRFWPVPSSQIWRTMLYYQLRAPMKKDLDDNWSPWPDELGYVLRSGLYAKALDHGEDPRANVGDSKWQMDIARALGIKQQTWRHEAFFPDIPIVRGG